MNQIFLIGGGWHAETFPNTYGRFLQAATRGNGENESRLLLPKKRARIRTPFRRFFNAFETVGLSSAEAFKIIVSAKSFIEKIFSRNKTDRGFCRRPLKPRYIHSRRCGPIKIGLRTFNRKQNSLLRIFRRCVRRIEKCDHRRLAARVEK